MYAISVSKIFSRIFNFFPVSISSLEDLKVDFIVRLNSYDLFDFYLF